MSGLGGAPSISMGQGLLAKRPGAAEAVLDFVQTLIDAASDGFIWTFDNNSGADPRTMDDKSPWGNDGTDYWALADIGNAPGSSGRAGTYGYDNPVQGELTDPGGVVLLDTSGFGGYPWTFVGVFSFPIQTLGDGKLFGFDETSPAVTNGQVGYIYNDHRIRFWDQGGLIEGTSGGVDFMGRTMMITCTFDGTDGTIWIDDYEAMTFTGRTNTAVDPEGIYGGYPIGGAAMENQIEFLAFLDGVTATQTLVDALWADIVDPADPEDKYIDTSIVLDVFSGTGTLDAHTPDVNTPGNSWVSGGTGYNISGGQAECTDSWELARIDCGIATACRIEAEVSFQDTSSQGGILFRYVDDSNFWWSQMTNGQLRLQRNVAGSVSTVATDNGGGNREADSMMTVCLDGTHIAIAVLDADYRTTPSYAEFLVTATDSNHQTAEIHGIQSERGAGSNLLFNSFRVWEVATL